MLRAQLRRRPPERPGRLRGIMRRTIALCRPPLRRSERQSPVIVVWGLVAIVLLGTGLLLLPWSAEEGQSTSPLTALFTSASAVCTTGMTVVDTQRHWSLFGELVIALLMQIGGLGFLTSSTIILLVIGRRLSLRDRLLVREVLGEGTLANAGELVRRIVLYALAVEAVGALLLALAFLPHQPPAVALWWGVFHSISSFTNASFDLIGGFQNVNRYGDAPFLLLVVTLLIIAGGLGFTPLADLRRRRRWQRLALDTKLVFVTTALLLAAGMAGFAAMEWTNRDTLGGLPIGDRLLQSWFFAVVPRTSGYATLDVASFRDETLFFLIGLMFIGGAAGSTAGGIKVNTLAVLAATVISASKGRGRVAAYGREIPISVIMRALTAAVLGLVIVINVALALSVSEPFRFIFVLFDAVSAFSTTGLSTGITPDLSVPGKLVTIGAMFVGRLGPLTLAFVLARRQAEGLLRYPEDSVRIG